ncbi:MAG: preprotein translocase subunit SecY [Candidatus Peregrinibacteria bacterium]|nr:preprotein translocase subunit SecY [Candidatus Peregrinibacteria bacterium]
MTKYLHQIWNSPDLRKKILFTLFAIVIFRILSQVSIPGANLDAIRGIFNRNQLLGAFNVLTGGSAENFSIILMGLSPYINASIIIQLLTVIIPSWDNLKHEGEMGQRKLTKWTRWLAVPLALLQSYGTIILLNTQSQVAIIQDIKNASVIIPVMLTITTGTMLLMWLGELISEKGIGNGISILIFAGIIRNLPGSIGQNLLVAGQDTEKLIAFVLILLMTVILSVIVILITEGQRLIPITYAGRGVKTTGSEDASLPIRINQAGMVPIIFAFAIISFPVIISQFLQAAKTEWLRNVAKWIIENFTTHSLLYICIYFLLNIVFTFFYVSITFNPAEVAENIQKRGGYVPGIRPGTQTAEYLSKVSNHLNLFGGVFIGLIAVIPMLYQKFFPGSIGSLQTLLSGAGMIIVVGVVLDLIRQVNAQLIMHDYKKFY